MRQDRIYPIGCIVIMTHLGGRVFPFESRWGRNAFETAVRPLAPLKRSEVRVTADLLNLTHPVGRPGSLERQSVGKHRLEDLT